MKRGKLFGVPRLRENGPLIASDEDREGFSQLGGNVQLGGSVQLGGDVPEPEGNVEEIDNAVLEQAERWYQRISQKGMKRKMMRNYLQGITDDSVEDSRIESMLDEAGL